MHGVWSATFRALYRVLRVADPMIRSVWRRSGIGNVVELHVLSRRTGRSRRVLLGVLRDGDSLYLGHPNGAAAWTDDLDAAGSGQLLVHGVGSIEFRPVLLAPGPERSAVIGATWQHPFPGNLVYRLARRHVLAAGRYYRLVALGATSDGET